MEHQKILNLLNDVNDFKFVTRKWNTVNDNSKANYDAGNENTYNTGVLESNLCDYNDVYISVTGDITVTAAPQIQVGFINSTPFTKCITKIDETTIDDAKYLDLVMPMYNLIECSSNILKQQKAYGFIQKMKQIILMIKLQTQMILNLSSIRLNY